jgi:tRNA (pseudouridine54-N1)-methyltransferase
MDEKQDERILSFITSKQRRFLLIANKAKTYDFNINDLPGDGGRMDIVCRFVAQSLFISHGVRRDSCAIVILLGEPEPPKTIVVDGEKVRYMSPDERNIAGLIKKALKKSFGVEKDLWIESTPGVYVSSIEPKKLIERYCGKIIYLREDGDDIAKTGEIEYATFIIGDHIGVPNSLESYIISRAHKTISISPISLQADQCVVIIHNFLDRRRYVEI